MKRYILAFLLAMVPSLGWPASWTYWYLGEKGSGYWFQYYMDGTYEHGVLKGPNQGWLRIDVPEGGLGGHIVTHNSRPKGWQRHKRSLGPVDFWFGPHGMSSNEDTFFDYTLAFDRNANLVAWSIGRLGLWPGELDYGNSSVLGERLAGDWVTGEIEFTAPRGTWYRHEADFVAAARAAGVAPIPLPAAGWLLAGGLAGLALLRRLRST